MFHLLNAKHQGLSKTIAFETKTFRIACVNPKGRPKGSKNLTTLFTEELRRSVILKENGKTRRVPKAEAIVKQVINKALSTDAKSTIIVLEEMRRLEALADEQHAVAPDIIRREDQATLKSIIQRTQRTDRAGEADNVGTRRSRGAKCCQLTPSTRPISRSKN